MITMLDHDLFLISVPAQGAYCLGENYYTLIFLTNFSFIRFHENLIYFGMSRTKDHFRSSRVKTIFSIVMYHPRYSVTKSGTEDSGKRPLI